ncbi:hypothetical protein [Pedobacter endophyticus]|uniref:Uncharacterized protein n=1 Tax=Pedobacter endophyticus TaxID=2789740 RepID=A0A7S9KZC5_9SPHI|nr:hypothetical protein [Pedobacter endophyticus]QPH39615.1 hypothetical protein IZT61_21670 [Pedobacter endophyticus]
MTKNLYVLLFASILFSCTEKKTEANNKLLYFDLQGYFKKESLRMKKANPSVFKTVSINGATESKKIKIADWEREFAVFINADINKASWKGSFQTNVADSKISYITNNKKIPVKKVTIARRDSTVSMVQIIIHNKNVLFQSNDTLTYYPDSLYDISKKQKIRILNEKNYKITGRLK